jgi:OOP family OmpA-OmpF porin
MYKLFKMNFKNTVIATALVTCSGLSMAGNFYFVGSVGSTQPADSVQSDINAAASGSGGSASSLSNGTGFKALLGYSFSDNLAVEGGYLNMGTMTTTLTAGAQSTNLDFKATGANVAVLGIAPINDKFALFGKLGYTSATGKATAGGFSNSEDKNSVGYGVGGKYKINETMAIRAEWEKLYEDINMVSVGVQVKF